MDYSRLGVIVGASDMENYAVTVRSVLKSLYVAVFCGYFAA